MARLEAPVMNTRRRAPAASASSTAYWISGLSTTGSISLGLALVAGRKRVPRPATGNTAVRIAGLETVIAGLSLCRARALIGALGPLEDRRAQAVPRAALRAVPVPADAVQPAVLALIAPAGVPDARQQRAERGHVGDRLHARPELGGDPRQLRHIAGWNRGRQQPGKLPRRDATALAQPPAELVHDVHAAVGVRDAQHRRDDLEREARRCFERLQVEEQRPVGVALALGEARGEDVGARELRLVRARLAQQGAGALGIALQQRVLGELAQVVRRDPPALLLHVRRERVEDLESLGPVALRLVDAHQVIERGVAILARGGELLEHLLGPVHEAGGEIIQRQREGRLVADAAAAVVAQPRVDGDRALDLAAPPEQAPESELDLRGIAVGLGHAREDLGG